MKLGVLILLLAAAVAPAQTNNLTALLQQGLFEEQANRNLDAAIADYQALARQFDKDRQLAATAVFRLGECYRMQGKTNEAALEYQRILRDFPDQATLATLSRQNLTGMGMTSAPAAAVALQTQKDLLSKQIDLAGQDLADAQRRAQTGVAPQADVRTAEREVLRLKQQLAALDSGRPVLTDLSVPASSEEDQEIQRIQTMIQNSPDLINALSNGNTPLGNAAAHGWLKVATFLLDHGADVNGGFGSALFSATRAGNRAMVELLLSRGANVNANQQDTEKNTPLHIAAMNGFQAVVEVLLANKADVNAQTRSGNTPLLLAAQGNNSKIVSLLLDHKADVNMQNNDGETPLSIAADRGQLENVKLLLAAGANPNALNQDGRTPLSFAAAIGSPEEVKMLLDAKADPNAGKLDLPLLCAIIKNDVASAELLLQAGAKPDSIGNFNLWRRPGFSGGIGDGSVGGRVGGRAGGSNPPRPFSPLSLAISEGQFPMVQLLLKYKTDPNEPEANGQSVLFNALSTTNILKALLDAGADVNARMDANVNRSLLHMASQFGPPESVALLLQHGANPNATDANGDTALHSAAQYLSDEKVVTVLLDHKANPNMRNDGGKTPLDIVKQRAQETGWTFPFDSQTAQKTRCDKLIALLRQRGALDDLPDWNSVKISRPSADFSDIIFLKGTNDWNRYTLLELIRRAYSGPRYRPPFPDLSRVAIVRPNTAGTESRRININLLNATNGVDCSKDVTLEFGDVIEIPEREHTLADTDTRLIRQIDQIASYLKTQAGEARLIVAGGQTIQLPLNSFELGDGYIGEVLQSSLARNVLTSASDLSRVKVTRRNPSTGKTSEWVLNCSQYQQSPGQLVSGRPSSISASTLQIMIQNATSKSSELWLRDGDVIEVPAKP